MYPLFEPIRNDLFSLYENDFIEAACDLNTALGRTFFSVKKSPMYFTGKIDAPTVFVMLNPGGWEEDNYLFSSCDKRQYKNFDQFVQQHIDKCIYYGRLDAERLDNFDLKQAAFLYNFIDSGVDIPNFFNEGKGEKTLKLKAKENVLMQKLQLELVPYLSKKFMTLFDNNKLANQNIEFFEKHIFRLLDVIILHERNFVIFGARQFYYLFQAFNEMGYAKIEFGESKGTNIKNLQKRVNCRTLQIFYKGNTITCLIADSFPRQDLPNAYDRMQEYGGFCYNVLKS